eukprot:CAMPEP_0198534966 /NCGR_PEP_ID=MMETSP1462-20131121/37486_1 /TAXON_ID=1333877 /ORGANISM="Brandtodinium nutriculum, Strain RCC3387" /LENGTH=53 /DNA_ID=CAMNT_0044264895 /DNA_START=18 /DNA_END=176 /DNA_ORIENTATION=-
MSRPRGSDENSGTTAVTLPHAHAPSTTSSWGSRTHACVQSSSSQCVLMVTSEV